MTSEDSHERTRKSLSGNNANYKPPLNSTPQHDPILSEICDKYKITPILYTALFNDNPNDRQFILNLEGDLVEFIKTPTADSWRLNPLNSYYRLLTHQIAEYYALGHILLKDACSMVIFKNNTSMVNGSKPGEEGAIEDKLKRTRLADLPNDLGDAYFSNSGPAVKKEEKKFKIMKKNEDAKPEETVTPSPVNSEQPTPTSSKDDDTLSREERYQRAREQIFVDGEDEEEEDYEDTNDNSNGNSNGNSNSTSPTNTRRKQYVPKTAYPVYGYPNVYYPVRQNSIPPQQAYQYPAPPQFQYYPGYAPPNYIPQYTYDTRGNGKHSNKSHQQRHHYNRNGSASSHPPSSSSSYKSSNGKTNNPNYMVYYPMPPGVPQQFNAKASPPFANPLPYFNPTEAPPPPMIPGIFPGMVPPMYPTMPPGEEEDREEEKEVLDTTTQKLADMSIERA